MGGLGIGFSVQSLAGRVAPISPHRTEKGAVGGDRAHSDETTSETTRRPAAENCLAPRPNVLVGLREMTKILFECSGK